MITKYKAKLKDLDNTREELLAKLDHALNIKDKTQAFARRRQIDCVTEQIKIVDEVLRDLEG